MIHNKEPIQVLWDWLKDLKDKDLKIYKEAMTEDDDSVPDSYVILRSEVTNSAERHGDGETILRGADCDIILVSKGPASTSKCLHNLNRKKIEKRLKEVVASYNGNNLGYDKEMKSSQYVWSTRIIFTA